MSRRTYLTNHGIHETLQDCVHALVLNRPDTTLEVLECLQSRIRANREKGAAEYYVVLAGNEKAAAAVNQHLTDIAAARGANVVDAAAASARAAAAAGSSYSYAASSHAAPPLLTPGSSAFVVNVKTIADAIRIQSSNGPCKGCVVVANEADLDTKEYLLNVNPVAQYYGIRAVNGVTVVAGVEDVNSALA